MNTQALIPARFKGADQRTTAEPGSSPDPAHLLRRLLVDPWLVAVAVMTVVFLATPDFHWLSTESRSLITDYFSSIVLLLVAVGAVLFGVKSMESQRERYFWRLLGLGLSAWLAGESLAFLFLDANNATAGIGVDSLYLCLYLAFVLALDTQPHATDGNLRIKPLRVLSTAGRTLFVSGLFGYFVVLPRIYGVDQYLTWIPSFSFFVVLDLYLVSRLISCVRLSRSPRWRLLYSLILVGWTMVLATDSMDFAWITSPVPEQFPRFADILWFAPMVMIVAASRTRHLTSSMTEATEADDDEDRVRGVPLLVYSLVFALIHLGLGLIQPHTGQVQDGRVALVMVCLAVFGVLHLFQHAVIEREIRQQRLRRKGAEAHIRSLSLTDPLTNILNRRAFDTELARAIARAERTGMVLGLMFVDLDHFKIVNDTWGHPAGDSILREAAARIKALTREIDTLARYGGDEFVLIFEAMETPADAEIVGRRILDGFKMGFQFESGRIELSASIGIAIHPFNGHTPTQLVEAADRAMYKAKEAGGSRVEFA